MVQGLLERDDALATLVGAFERVRGGGPGHVAIVSGEAGVGKTSVLRALAGSLHDAEVLWGTCDGLRTPRPLGPLLDIAAAAGGELAATAGTSDPGRDALFAALLQRLRAPVRPVLVVVEDAHWADDATFDLLTFLGRRAPTTRALLAVSYRDDEVGAGHPLRVVLGDLGAATKGRVRLRALSLGAVEQLAEGSGIDPVDLHAVTGGNPFYVTESLAAGTGEVPDSVRDAVLSRASRLSPPARHAMEAVALVPGRAELWLVEAVAGPDVAGLDECVDRGVITVSGEHVALRHELARLAIVEAIPPHRRRGLHRRVLAAMDERGVSDATRLTFHALEAGDVDALLRHGPVAAEQASTAGAHRQAAAHLEEVVAHGDRLPAPERTRLSLRLAEELYVVGRYDDSVATFDRAAACARQVGDRRSEGRSLAKRGGPLTMAARSTEALTSSRAAVELLELEGPCLELAEAYASLGSGLMLSRHLAEALEWLDRAEALGQTLGAESVVSHARIQAGVAQLMAGLDVGLDRINDGIALARRLDRDDQVALGLSQIGSGGGEVRRYDLAAPALRECVGLARDRDLISAELYSLAWLARCELELGHWDEAATIASSVLARDRATGISRFVALLVVGRLRARRGDPEVWTALDDALALARQSDHLQRLWPVAAGRAEAAWLEDRLDDEIPLVRAVYDTAVDLAYPWAVGELGHWLARGGELTSLPPHASIPYRLHADGRFAEAAAAWRDIGCPYEEAEALADTGDPAAMRTALAMFDSLGASPAASRTVRRLRALGERVARGPNRAARANPGGLTQREVEVLTLVAAGQSNAELADRLGITVKTAGHHVSHILTKLAVANRAEAAVRAMQLGIVSPET